jgi:hypothetical protein
VADEVLVRVPAPSFAFIGWESDAAVSGSVSMTLPMPVVLIGNVETNDIAVPMPTMSFSGTVGATTVLTNNIVAVPMPVMAFTGSPGVIGSVNIRAPAPVVALSEGNRVTVTAPAPRMAFTAVTGTIGSVDMTAPVPTAAFAGEAPYVAQLAVTVRPTMSFGGVTGVVGSVNVTMARVALALEGHTGVIGSVAITVPVVDMALGGGQDIVGSLSITVPMLTVSATGRTAAAGVTQGYALRPVKVSENRPEVMALSLYDDLPAFNSMASFNGVYLAATAQGIFALSGDLDGAANIDAVIRTGSTDFGTSHLKRVEAVWLQYETTGSLTLTVITDGGVRHSYPVPPTGSIGLHGLRVPVGRGIQSKYWAFEVANVEGCSFGMDLIEARPQVLKRRHGGGNA